MGESVYTNPLGANQSITDFTTFENTDGIFVGGELYGQRCIYLRANATTVKGDILSLVAPTATVPLSVTPSTTTANESYRGIGVAAEAAAAGERVKIVVEGPAEVNVGTADPVFGDILTYTANTTAGVATVVALGTWAASNFAKTVGTVIAPDDATGTTTQAIVWVEPGL